MYMLGIAVVLLVDKSNCLCSDGVVLVDSEYFGRESKKDRKGEDALLEACSADYHLFCRSVSAVFVQVLVGFRYGRDDLDVLGLNNSRRDLVDVRDTLKDVYITTVTVYLLLKHPLFFQERLQVFPPPDPTKPQLLTLLQVRLLKKLGRNAYPFTFSVSLWINKIAYSSLSLSLTYLSNTCSLPWWV